MSLNFQTALSGLNGAAGALDTIGNNVANSNTVGFKKADKLFADMFATTMGRATPLGTSDKYQVQRFTQGGLTETNNPYDLAINGKGFFQLNSTTATTGAETAYSRNGQFEAITVQTGALSSTYLRNADGYYLNGWAANTPTTTAPTPLVIGSFSAPNTTPTMAAQATTTTSLEVNLDASSTAPATSPFDPADPTSYNWATFQTVYDSTGNTHDLGFYFAGDPVTLTWDVYARLDGVAPSEEAAGPRQLFFDAQGLLWSSNSLTSTFAVAGMSPLTTTFPSMTQYNGNFAVTEGTQNGFGVGQFTGVEFTDKGAIIANYSNGQELNIGTLALADFSNLNGLQPLGGNLWAETSASGTPTYGAPNSGNGFGRLDAGAVENSNVDLSAELVNMIIQQRAYQANAQAVKTQDSVLQTLSSLR
jgi:flagellar hook protein FlgE